MLFFNFLCLLYLMVYSNGHTISKNIDRDEEIDEVFDTIANIDSNKHHRNRHNRIHQSYEREDLSTKALDVTESYIFPEFVTAANEAAYNLNISTNENIYNEKRTAIKRNTKGPGRKGREKKHTKNKEKGLWARFTGNHRNTEPNSTVAFTLRPPETLKKNIQDKEQKEKNENAHGDSLYATYDISNSTEGRNNVFVTIELIGTELNKLKELYSGNSLGNENIPFVSTDFPKTAELEELLTGIKMKSIETIIENDPGVIEVISNAVTESTYTTSMDKLVPQASKTPYADYGDSNLFQERSLKQRPDNPNEINYTKSNRNAFGLLHKHPKKLVVRSATHKCSPLERFEIDVKRIYNKMKSKVYRKTPTNTLIRTSMKKTQGKAKSTKANKKIGDQPTSDFSYLYTASSNASSPMPSKVNKTKHLRRSVKQEKIKLLKNVPPDAGYDKTYEKIIQNLPSFNLWTMIATPKSPIDDKQKVNYKSIKRSLMKLTNNEPNVALNEINKLDFELADPFSHSNVSEGLHKKAVYTDLSKKISYHDYVNGYKHYLKFQRELGEDDNNFSPMVKYQAHRHHKVDDIGKYILNKIPQLTTLDDKTITSLKRQKKNIIDEKNIETKPALKSDSDWINKHILFLLDKHPKKYHTSQIVPLKSPVNDVGSEKFITKMYKKHHENYYGDDCEEIKAGCEETTKIDLDALSKALHNCDNRSFDYGSTNVPTPEDSTQNYKHCNCMSEDDQKQSPIHMHSYDLQQTPIRIMRSLHVTPKNSNLPQDSPKDKKETATKFMSSPKTIVTTAKQASHKDIKNQHKKYYRNMHTSTLVTVPGRSSNSTSKSKFRGLFRKFQLNSRKSEKKYKRAGSTGLDPIKRLKNIFKIKGQDRGKAEKFQLPDIPQETKTTSDLMDSSNLSNSTTSISKKTQPTKSLKNIDQPLEANITETTKSYKSTTIKSLLHAPSTFKKLKHTTGFDKNVPHLSDIDKNIQRLSDIIKSSAESTSELITTNQHTSNKKVTNKSKNKISQQYNININKVLKHTENKNSEDTTKKIKKGQSTTSSNKNTQGNQHKMIEYIPEKTKNKTNEHKKSKMKSLMPNINTNLQTFPNTNKYIKHPTNVNKYHGNSRNQKNYNEHSQPNFNKFKGHSPNANKYNQHSPNINKYNEHSQNVHKYKENSPNINKYKEHSPNINKYNEHSSNLNKYIQQNKYNENSPEVNKYNEQSLDINKYIDQSLGINNNVEDMPDINKNIPGMNKNTEHSVKIDNNIDQWTDVNKVNEHPTTRVHNFEPSSDINHNFDHTSHRIHNFEHSTHNIHDFDHSSDKIHDFDHSPDRIHNCEHMPDVNHNFEHSPDINHSYEHSPDRTHKFQHLPDASQNFDHSSDMNHNFEHAPDMHHNFEHHNFDHTQDMNKDIEHTPFLSKDINKIIQHALDINKNIEHFPEIEHSLNIDRGNNNFNIQALSKNKNEPIIDIKNNKKTNNIQHMEHSPDKCIKIAPNIYKHIHCDTDFLKNIKHLPDILKNHMSEDHDLLSSSELNKSTIDDPEFLKTMGHPLDWNKHIYHGPNRNMETVPESNETTEDDAELLQEIEDTLHLTIKNQHGSQGMDNITYHKTSPFSKVTQSGSELIRAMELVLNINQDIHNSSELIGKDSMLNKNTPDESGIHKKIQILPKSMTGNPHSSILINKDNTTLEESEIEKTINKNIHRGTEAIKKTASKFLKNINSTPSCKCKKIKGNRKDSKYSKNKNLNVMNKYTTGKPQTESDVSKNNQDKPYSNKIVKLEIATEDSHKEMPNAPQLQKLFSLKNIINTQSPFNDGTKAKYTDPVKSYMQANPKAGFGANISAEPVKFYKQDDFKVDLEANVSGDTIKTYKQDDMKADLGANINANPVKSHKQNDLKVDLEANISGDPAKLYKQNDLKVDLEANLNADPTKSYKQDDLNVDLEANISADPDKSFKQDDFKSDFGVNISADDLITNEYFSRTSGVFKPLPMYPDHTTKKYENYASIFNEPDIHDPAVLRDIFPSEPSTTKKSVLYEKLKGALHMGQDKNKNDQSEVENMYSTEHNLPLLSEKDKEFIQTASNTYSTEVLKVNKKEKAKNREPVTKKKNVKIMKNGTTAVTKPIKKKIQTLPDLNLEIARMQNVLSKKYGAASAMFTDNPIFTAIMMGGFTSGQIYKRQLTPIDSSEENEAETNSQTKETETKENTPALMVDSTLLSYDGEVETVANGVQVNQVKNSDIKRKEGRVTSKIKKVHHKSKVGKIITKAKERPEMYYSTPLPMKPEEFARFLKEQGMDVASVTSPLHEPLPLSLVNERTIETTQITNESKTESLEQKRKRENTIDWFSPDIESVTILNDNSYDEVEEEKPFDSDKSKPKGGLPTTTDTTDNAKFLPTFEPKFDRLNPKVKLEPRWHTNESSLFNTVEPELFIQYNATQPEREITEKELSQLEEKSTIELAPEVYHPDIPTRRTKPLHNALLYNRTHESAMSPSRPGMKTSAPTKTTATTSNVLGDDIQWPNLPNPEEVHISSHHYDLDISFKKPMPKPVTEFPTSELNYEMTEYTENDKDKFTQEFTEKSKFKKDIRMKTKRPRCNGITSATKNHRKRSYLKILPHNIKYFPDGILNKKTEEVENTITSPVSGLEDEYTSTEMPVRLMRKTHPWAIWKDIIKYKTDPLNAYKQAWLEQQDTDLQYDILDAFKFVVKEPEYVRQYNKGQHHEHPSEDHLKPNHKEDDREFEENVFEIRQKQYTNKFRPNSLHGKPTGLFTVVPTYTPTIDSKVRPVVQPAHASTSVEYVAKQDSKGHETVIVPVSKCIKNSGVTDSLNNGIASLDDTMELSKFETAITPMEKNVSIYEIPNVNIVGLEDEDFNTQLESSVENSLESKNQKRIENERNKHDTHTKIVNTHGTLIKTTPTLTTTLHKSHTPSKQQKQKKLNTHMKKKPHHKRNAETQSTCIARDVAALEVMVDLMKNTGDEEKEIGSVPTDPTYYAIHNEATNAIQVHIVVPCDVETGLKRSLGPVRIRKIFSAKMSTPVDLEYQVHSVEESPTLELFSTTPVTKGLSPGIYMLLSKPNDGYALKPVRAQSSPTSIATTKENETENTARLKLSKDFVEAVSNKIEELFDNLSIVNKSQVGPRQRRHTVSAPITSVYKSTKSTGLKQLIKKYLGYDNICNCKCVAYKPMCRDCSATNAVIEELITSFDNIVKYMTDHCTEIQTYFWMNPSGGLKLRDSVDKVSKNLHDYYKRTKGKCKGRPCNSLANHIDKRQFAKTLNVNQEKSNKTFLDALISAADNFNKTLESILGYKFNNEKEQTTHEINSYVPHQAITKRFEPENKKKKIVKNVYSLDSININLICNSDNTSHPLASTTPLTTLKMENPNTLYLNEFDYKISDSKPTLFKSLFWSNNFKRKDKAKPIFLKKSFKRDAVKVNASSASENEDFIWIDTKPSQNDEYQIVRRTIKHPSPILGITELYPEPQTVTDYFSQNLNKVLDLFQNLQDVESSMSKSNGLSLSQTSQAMKAEDFIFAKPTYMKPTDRTTRTLTTTHLTSASTTKLTTKFNLLKSLKKTLCPKFKSSNITHHATSAAPNSTNLTNKLASIANATIKSAVSKAAKLVSIMSTTKKPAASEHTVTKTSATTSKTSKAKASTPKVSKSTSKKAAVSEHTTSKSKPTVSKTTKAKTSAPTSSKSSSTTLTKKQTSSNVPTTSIQTTTTIPPRPSSDVIETYYIIYPEGDPGSAYPDNLYSDILLPNSNNLSKRSTESTQNSLEDIHKQIDAISDKIWFMQQNTAVTDEYKPKTQTDFKNTEKELDKIKSKQKQTETILDQNVTEHKETGIGLQKAQPNHKQTETEVNQNRIEQKQTEAVFNKAESKEKQAETQIDQKETEQKEAGIGLKKAEPEHRQMETELNQHEQTGTQLKNTKSELNENQTTAKQTETEFKKTESELKQSQTEVDQNDTGHKETEVEFRKGELKHKETETELNQNEIKQKQTETELKKAESEQKTDTELDQNDAENKETGAELKKDDSESAYKQTETKLDQPEAKQTGTELGKEPEFKKTETELNENKITHKQTGTELKAESEQKSETELQQKDVGNKETGAELKKNYSEHKQTETELKQSVTNHKQTETELKKPETEAVQNKNELKESGSELKKTDAQLNENKTYKQTGTEFKKSESEHKQTEAEIKQIETKHEQLSSELKKAESELKKTQKETEHNPTGTQLNRYGSELKQTETKPKQNKTTHQQTESKTGIKKAESELQHEETELDQTEAELNKTGSELKKHGSGFKKTSSALKQVESVLNQKQTTQAQTESLKEEESELKQTETELDQNEVELNKTESELKKDFELKQTAFNQKMTTSKQNGSDLKKTESEHRQTTAGLDQNVNKHKQTETKLKIDESEQKLTKPELEKETEHAQSGIEGKNAESKQKQSETEVEENETDREQTGTEVNKAESELKKSESELKQTETGLNQKESELEQAGAAKSKYKQTETAMKETGTGLLQRESELNRAEAELNQTETELRIVSHVPTFSHIKATIHSHTKTWYPHSLWVRLSAASTPLPPAGNTPELKSKESNLKSTEHDAKNHDNVKSSNITQIIIRLPTNMENSYKSIFSTTNYNNTSDEDEYKPLQEKITESIDEANNVIDSILPSSTEPNKLGDENLDITKESMSERDIQMVTAINELDRLSDSLQAKNATNVDETKTLLLSIIEYEMTKLNKEWHKVANVVDEDNDFKRSVTRTSTVRQSTSTTQQKADTTDQPEQSKTERTGILNKLFGMKVAKRKAAHAASTRVFASALSSLDACDNETTVSCRQYTTAVSTWTPKQKASRDQKRKTKNDEARLLCPSRDAVCDLQATFNYAAQLRDQVSQRTFEKYVKEVPCHKYKRLKRGFLIHHKTSGLKWNWIRSKRSSRFAKHQNVERCDDQTCSSFDKFVKDSDGIYRLLEREKRSTGRSSDHKLRDYRPLKIAKDELYVMAGDSVILECPLQPPRIAYTEYSWEADPGDLLDYGNVEANGPTLDIKKVAPRNAGRYSCIVDGIIRKTNTVTVVSLPTVDVVFIPTYKTQRDCTYDDLRAIQQLGHEMSKAAGCGDICSIRIDEPVCQRDKVSNKSVIKSTGVLTMSARPLECSVMCRRDMFASLVRLALADIPVMENSKVILSKDNVNETLVPYFVVSKLVTTHTLRKKDSSGHFEYRKSKMLPGRVKPVIICGGGYYFVDHSGICVPCPSKTRSSAGDNSCSPCPPGTSSARGATECHDVLKRPRRYDWWWYPPCGYVVALSILLCACGVCLALALVVHLVSRAELRASGEPASSTSQDKNYNKRSPMTAACVHSSRRRHLSPSRVILARFFKYSMSSSRGTIVDSQETRFERWKEKNIPPSLPTIDFDLETS